MKTKIIIIRGIRVKVAANKAKEMEELEKKQLQSDWNKNQLD